MRRLLLLVLLALASSAQAQRARPFAEKGDVALVVGISPVDFPAITSALDGVGVRYRATDRSVVGISVGFSASSLDAGDAGGSRGAGRGRVSV